MRTLPPGHGRLIAGCLSASMTVMAMTVMAGAVMAGGCGDDSLPAFARPAPVVQDDAAMPTGSCQSVEDPGCDTDAACAATDGGAGDCP